MCGEWKCWDSKEAVAKYTLGIQKRPRRQPCECMKDELWLSLPGRQRDGPCTQEVGSMAVRGREDKKQLFSKHQ